jgi:hypothetical protein
MPSSTKKTTKRTLKALKKFFSLTSTISISFAVISCILIYSVSYSHIFAVKYAKSETSAEILAGTTTPQNLPQIPFDVGLFDAKLRELAHVSISTATASSTALSTVKVPTKLWPVKFTSYPHQGALLPFNRIVAFYGNFYSKGMGVLGEYPEDIMIAKLKAEVKVWESADPKTPVIPAIDYIDVTAQGSPGKDGKYRLRMPDTEIDKAVALAHKVNGIVILDVQVGLSNIQSELPLLTKYLMMPEVHLALDPEFSMKTGKKPGSVIGTMDASDINYAENFLAQLVRTNNLPPKILIVHRFTRDMMTGYKGIKQLPEVQVVVDMDGWGSPAKKTGTYTQIIAPEPVQFTGFKLFYKNDIKAPSTRMMTPKEVLNLTPSPSFIQYQ